MSAPSMAVATKSKNPNSFLLLIQSSYNFYTSTIVAKKLVSVAKKHNVKALAWVESNTLSGAFEFIRKCKESGIKPLVGLEVEFDSFKYVIYALKSNSLKLLYKLSSSINSKVKTSKEEIQIMLFDKGLKTFLIVENERDIVRIKSALNTKSRVICTKKFLIEKLDPDQYYIVYSPRISIISEKERDILELLKKMGSNKIDISEVSYEEAIEGEFQEVDFIDEIEIDMRKKREALPTLNSRETWEYFESLCYDGLEKRLNTSKVPREYFLRLKKELLVIKEKKFYRYFLIFFHICKFCREKGILLGPGRGSAPGSLITYILYITELDPLKNGLIFERFLNPERQSLPDIDLDVEDTRRDEVVNFIYSTYGFEHVSNIGTYSTFGLKGAFREVAKMLEIKDYVIKEVSALLPSTYFQVSLRDLLDKSNKLLEQYSVNESVKRALDYSDKIRDLPRHSSIHAAGMIASQQNLKDIIPISLSASSGLYVTQWQFSEIEAMGLPKLDILGLRNLTIIRRILQAIYQYRGTYVSLKKMYMHDRKVYKTAGEGKVNGIFQLESPGMRNVLRKIRPQSVEEIGLVSALFRPGASNHIDECARNKKNSSLIEKIHPIIDSILSTTFGVIVYQEQVIEIIVKFAGLSYGQADVMRRAMSKKNLEEANHFKEVFLKSCQSKNYDSQLSLNIWKSIERFASYGFNKSHALAYALISYWMLYLKTHYSLEFFLTSFQAFYADKIKLHQYLHESKYSFSILTLNPNINLSGSKFRISDGKIYSPLTLVKGIGEETSKDIQEDVMNNGPFRNYLTAVMRLKKIVSATNIKNLIKAGAFADFEESTTTMLLNLENVITYWELIDKSPSLPKPKLTHKKDKIIDLSNWEVFSIGTNISRSVFDILSILEEKEMPRRYIELLKFKGELLNTIVFLKNLNSKKTKNGQDYLVLKVYDGQEEFIIMAFDKKTVEQGLERLKKNHYFLLCVQVKNSKSEDYEESIVLRRIKKRYRI